MSEVDKKVAVANKMKARYPAAFALGASMFLSTQAFALDAAQNTQITDGYSAVEVTVAAIIAALLSVILGIAGWSIIKGLLK